MAKSSTFDRRGFDELIYLYMALMVVYAILGVYYSWKLALLLEIWQFGWYMILISMTAQPSNNPIAFGKWSRTRDSRRPVLLCLGDSITCGTCSADIPSAIPSKLCALLGMPEPNSSTDKFQDPVWVVNAAQNGITTHTILHERLSAALAVHPDYIYIMIGTNDVQAMCNPHLRSQLVKNNGLPEVPTLHTLEQNLTGIIHFIHEASPKVEIGICTIPPLGEDMKSEWNAWVRQANEVVERVVTNAATSEKVTLIPVFQRMESILEKQTRRGTKWPYEYFLLASLIQLPIYHLAAYVGGNVSWNTLSKPFGYHFMADGLHLNENGREVVVDLIVEWLKKKNVAKAILVKS